MTLAFLWFKARMGREEDVKRGFQEIGSHVVETAESRTVLSGEGSGNGKRP